MKYYSPLHVSSIKCSSSGGHSCIQAAYGTVTLCKSAWWPVLRVDRPPETRSEKHQVSKTQFLSFRFLNPWIRAFENLIVSQLVK